MLLILISIIPTILTIILAWIQIILAIQKLPI